MRIFKYYIFCVNIRIKIMQVNFILKTTGKLVYEFYNPVFPGTQCYGVSNKFHKFLTMMLFPIDKNLCKRCKLTDTTSPPNLCTICILLNAKTAFSDFTSKRMDNHVNGTKKVFN